MALELAGPVPELVSGAQEPDVDPYLTDFSLLGERIYHYIPVSPQRTISEVPSPSTNEHNSEIDPNLIIFCSWMYAASKHIVKYTDVYRSKYPTSQILLLRQDGGDFFSRTNAQQMKNLAPAVEVIRSLEEQRNQGRRLNVLMHIFSNGGSWTACQLSDAYPYSTRIDTSSTGQNGHLLPISALIFDSTPSLPNLGAAVTAFSANLPRSPSWLHHLSRMGIYAYLRLGQFVDCTVLGREDRTLNLRRRLNDPEGAFMQYSHSGTVSPDLETRPRRLGRTYIYSHGDLLIPAKDVELHADEAKDVLGQEGVQLENFGNTMHVSHVRGDADRYWKVVDRAWRERMS